jgi:hypothetical protein
MDRSDSNLPINFERFEQLYSNYSDLSKFIERESPSMAKGVRLRLLSLRGSWVQIPSPALIFDDQRMPLFLLHKLHEMYECKFIHQITKLFAFVNAGEPRERTQVHLP